MRINFGAVAMLSVLGFAACGDDKIQTKDTSGTDSTIFETTPTDTTGSETRDTTPPTTPTDTAGETEDDTTTTDTTVVDTEDDTSTTDTSTTDTSTTDTSTTDTSTTDTTTTDTTATDTTVDDTTDTTVDDTTDTTATDTTATDTTVTDTDTDTDTSNPTPTEQIQTVLDALGAAASANGPFTVAGAYVTYLKPAVGSGTDVPGFFLQAVQSGPALFVEWSGTPAVHPGDVVTVAFASVARNHTPPSAKGVTAVTVTATGKTTEVAALSQEVTAVDFVTALGNYQSELVEAFGEVTSQRNLAGAGFESVKFDTDVVIGSANLELRYPETLGPVFDLTPGCLFQVVGVPVWRFDARAQVSFFEASELDVSCDAPTVVGAKAIGPTTVVVTFDRAIDPASIEVDLVPLQFTFDGGLGAVSAVVDGRNVVITTSAQVAGQVYKVTVDDSVTDVLGSAVDATANTATFNGFTPLDHLVINEFDYDQDGNDTLEFVEIYNPTAADISLVGYSLVGMNGDTGTSYRTTHLDNAVKVPAHGYLVVGSKDLIATVAAAANVVTFRFGTGASNEADQIQNGAPDALRLEKSGAVIDAVSYEGTVTGSVEGTALLRLTDQYDESKWVISDFQRCPDGTDANDNSKDFKLAYPLSPGVANGCGAAQALP